MLRRFGFFRRRWWPTRINPERAVIPLSAAPPPIQFVGSVSGFYSGAGGQVTLDLTALTGGIDTAAREGDVVFVMHASRRSSDEEVGVATAGYTEVADIYGSANEGANLSVSHKRMGPTPDTSVTTNTLVGGRVCAIAYVLRNVDPDTVLDVAVVTATKTNSGIADPGSITPLNAGALVLAVGASISSTTTALTGPSGYSNHVTICNTSNANYIHLGVAMKAWTSGSEDPGAWSGVTDNALFGSAAVTIAVRRSPLNRTYPSPTLAAYADVVASSAVVAEATVVTGTVHTASATLVAQAGRRNRVTSPDMTGAVVGQIGAGGSLPTGWVPSIGGSQSMYVEGFGTLSDGQSYIDIRFTGSNPGATALNNFVYFIGNGSTYREATSGDRIVFGLTSSYVTGNVGSATVTQLIREFQDTTVLAGISFTTFTPDGTRRLVTRDINGATTNAAWCSFRLQIPVGGAPYDVTYRLTSPQVERDVQPDVIYGYVGNQSVLGTATAVRGASAAISSAASLTATADRIRQTTATLVSLAGRRNLVRSPDMTGAVVGKIGVDGLYPTGWLSAVSNSGVQEQWVEGFGTLPDGQSYIDIRHVGTNGTAGNYFSTVHFLASSDPQSAAIGETFVGSLSTQLLSGSFTGGAYGQNLLRGYNGTTQIEATLPTFTPTGTLTRASVTRTMNTAGTSSVWFSWRVVVPAGVSYDLTIRYVSPQVERTASPSVIYGYVGNQAVLATATGVREAAASLSASSTLSVSATGVREAVAALSASSTLSVSATCVKEAAASLNSTATVTVDARRVGNADAALACTSSLTATPIGIRPADATVSATGALSVTTERHRFVSASLLAQAVVDAFGESFTGGSAGLYVTTALAVQTSALFVRSAVLAGDGATLSVGGGNRLRSADLSASSSLSAVPAVIRDGVSVLHGQAELVAAAIRVKEAAAAVEAAADVHAEYTTIRPRSATLEATSATQATATRTRERTADLTASASLTSDRASIRSRSATLDASASLAAAPNPIRKAAAEVSASASISAEYGVNRVVAVEVSGATSVSVGIIRERYRAATLASVGSVSTDTVVRVREASSSVDSNASVSAIPSGLFDRSVTLVALVSLNGVAGAHRASGASLSVATNVETDGRRFALRSVTGESTASVAVEEVQRIRARDVELVGLAAGVATAGATRPRTASVSGAATVAAIPEGRKTGTATLAATGVAVTRAHSRVRRRANGGPAVLLGI